jgi:hypothetical protein
VLERGSYQTRLQHALDPKKFPRTSKEGNPLKVVLVFFSKGEFARWVGASRQELCKKYISE